MKYLPIATELFKTNRAKFIKHLKPNSIAIFVSNDAMPTNADGTMGFKQNSDLFYLTGIDQENTMLILYPDAVNNDFKEILFVQETNEHIAIWEGEKLNKAQATTVSGIENVVWVNNFKSTLQQFVFQAEAIYLNANEHARQGNVTQTHQDRFNAWVKEKYTLHKIERSAPIMHTIRAIKTEHELALIQQACNITEKGFRRLLGFVKPNVMEYEIEAELIHEFVRNRSQGFAYSPIIASGFNACVLHYIENNKACKAGDVILLDVAAEYGNYASDMTRCLPVSGRFTPRQKQVYNAVHKVMNESIKMLTVGNTFEKYNKAVGELMTEELLQLGLITTEEVKAQNPKAPAYKKYFMHGTSHFLGLDVHDVGIFSASMEAGMVFTCEPGIYIREENLGIRLENNILITPTGNYDMMANIPINAEEIEDLMNK
jgi:Xaa-Pro aminopeptidase